MLLYMTTIFKICLLVKGYLISICDSKDHIDGYIGIVAVGVKRQGLEVESPPPAVPLLLTVYNRLGIANSGSQQVLG